MANLCLYHRHRCMEKTHLESMDVVPSMISGIHWGYRPPIWTRRDNTYIRPVPDARKINMKSQSLLVPEMQITTQAS